MIESKIIKDSLNTETGDRLTSWIWTYPRFIHSEVMTHRLFSRNAASSRAIPVKKQIAQVEDGANWVLAQPDLANIDFAACPLAIPVDWGSNNPGMQSKAPLSESDRSRAVERWSKAALESVNQAHQLNDIGAHKQIVNRVLEPFVHMTVLVTSSNWGNFFSLRAHPDSQPEFQKLAYMCIDIYNDNVPAKLQSGDWHLPFEDNITEKMNLDDIIRICIARAARTSYTTFNGDYDAQKDFDLHDNLKSAGHMSPFEHVAVALSKEDNFLAGMEQRGNFWGFQQYRKLIDGECRNDRRIIDKLPQ
tara:strand:- start:189 stop:1100 length:912 start_codon:yes stop_codon:yes gene_type:complete